MPLPPLDAGDCKLQPLDPVPASHILHPSKLGIQHPITTHQFSQIRDP